MLFASEVMGRNCGYLALIAGITGGAEVVVIPEVEMPPEEIIKELRSAYDRGKAHAFAVVAEGARYNARALSSYFQEQKGEVRFSIAGHDSGPRTARRHPGSFRSFAGDPFRLSSRRTRRTREWHS